MISTPVNGSATMEMSGTCRVDPASALWNAGLANIRLDPPPAPPWKPRCNGGTTGGEPSVARSATRVRLLPQPVWQRLVLSGVRNRLVTPVPVDFGELAR